MARLRRKGADPGDEKCRITFEARQGVPGFFDEGAKVRGHILPSILVVKGAYARLDNIDLLRGCEDRTASWQVRQGLDEELRAVAHFEGLVVFQQPVASMSGIT